jgi:hypothetical protein
MSVKSFGRKREKKNKLEIKNTRCRADVWHQMFKVETMIQNARIRGVLALEKLEG